MVRRHQDMDDDAKRSCGCVLRHVSPIRHYMKSPLCLLNSTAKKIIGFTIYCLLMLIYVPFYIFGMLLIQKGIAMLKLRKRLGLFHRKEGRLGLVSRRSRVTDIACVSMENELDFLYNRSPAYIWRMCFSMPWELVKTILRQEKIQLISDDQLAYVILNTVFAHSVCWDDDRKMYRLVMEGFEDLFLFQGFYWDARHVLVSPDAKKIIIQMSDGQEYNSDCEQRLRPTFDLAKLHVQVCLSYFAPGLSHNHVHFVLPSAVAVLSQKLLNRNGILYKLLYQHFRFTERINYQALRVQKATNNKRSALDRLFFFWQPFPLTKEQFLEGVARKCKKHYFDKGMQECKENEEEKGEISNIMSQLNTSPCRSGKLDSIPEFPQVDELEPRIHHLFPPDFTTDRRLQKIPYLNFLAQYYFVIRDFVKSMIPFIDGDEWKLLSTEVAKHVPRFDKCSMVDAIATYIHQVGVIHFCDHNSYLRYFAFRYGSMAIRVPFEPFENLEDWEEFALEHNFDLNEVRGNPLLLMRQRDVLRTRSFLLIFVDFIPSAKLNLHLINTDYEFSDTGPEMAAENFRLKLRALDGNLKLQRSVLPILSSPGEQRAEGMRLVPLDDIVRTVCY
ncbi:uncharacterized protein LOC120345131 isoform X2 [Styela clava]|uniref:uncharacterized protein LOC120345131 n=1 Tax=Styela clava TaxID=7725 RepID=UPI00193A7870|nr:uncharacterized protein LOC120345131 [Styela clava]